MRLLAHAKINLGLEVLGKRADGYHEIVTVLQRIELHDTLSLELSDNLNLTCDCPQLVDPGNLVLRAAKLLQENTASRRGATLRLEKRIPLAAGLGGGSTDAAVTLRALNELWLLGQNKDQLVGLAAKLGSDVPFFLDGPTALAEGRGERLQTLPASRRQWVVLVVAKLDIPDKTRTLYTALQPRDYSNGALTRSLAKRLKCGKGIDAGALMNVFEPLVLQRYELVQKCRAAMLEAGAPWVSLSGSGPALFTLLANRDAAQQLCDRLFGLLRPEQAEIVLTYTHG